MTSFNVDAIGRGLPAHALQQPLRSAIIEHRAAVVTSPPGSGKTTVVPPVLANIADGRVLVAQPRRVTARAAARHLATLTGTPLGDLVGYTVRDDSRVSRNTRVEFVTAGVLVRRLLGNPDLSGVSAVVLDEVHERSIDADLAFAFSQQIALLRDDLAVVAMSATLEAAQWSALLGDAPVLSVPMELHPLTENWAPFPGHRLDERGVRREFLAHIAATTREAMAAHPEHSALVFLPGHREVERVVTLLRADGIEAVPLTGSLSATEQDAVLQPARNGAQRAVVATSVAESSLTVPDIRIVVDSCLAREPRLDLARGISGLVTVSMSQDSGRQRAGRAARVGPGAVYRCVSEAQWASFSAARKPEITTVDLTETALLLALWGDAFARDLALPDHPAPDALRRAQQTLQLLGAVTITGDGTVEITDLGKQLVRFPAHPRLARALIDAAPRIGAVAAAGCVATLQSIQRAPRCDLAALDRQLRRGDDAAARQWRRERDRLQRLLTEVTAAQPPSESAAALPREQALAFVAAAAHPERIACARGGDGSYLLASGTGAQLHRDAALLGQQWLVVTDVARAHAADGSGAQIRAAVPITKQLALEVAATLHTTVTETALVDGRVKARSYERLGAITLSETAVAPTPDQALECVRDEFARRGPQLLHWSMAAQQLRNRLAFVRRYLGDPWPDVSDAALREQGADWLAPEFTQLAQGASLRSVDLVAALQRLLPWPEAAGLPELAPEHLRVPTGSKIRIEYPQAGETDAPARCSVKLQECFGMLNTPLLVGGRAPLVMQLLSPAQRPVAITEDLASFWQQGYPQVRAELRGRYSKHPWPEDPWTAPPQRGTKKSGR
ncbi:ATP-dependent helicase HrpB [uncultured Gulosibacter sp.]|uniref:ATP-dependent helicase HrpB n=1 Tax=uncultured Gulosibacter sp. TaxID=1339167 RepID=UPI0028893DFC|nr:ATP-dependent helicase HrpB [uncultured Gulosibacter sp.]